MSAVLALDAVLAQVRGAFTRAELATVEPYGGQFNGEGIGRLSFACPAVLVTVLGWQPAQRGRVMAGRHVRELRLAAFVVTRHARRDERLRQAMALSEALALRLAQWAPDAAPGLELAPLEDEPRCENLYGPAVDDAGLALWLVTWAQCARATLAPEQLWDLLRVEITDHTAQGVVAPDDAPAPPPIVVTEDVRFKPLAPPT